MGKKSTHNKKPKTRKAVDTAVSSDDPKPIIQPFGEVLTNEQEEFCRYYAQGEGTFGNATLSYAAAYDFDLTFTQNRDRFGNIVSYPNDWKVYNVCSSSGSRLLRHAKIRSRVHVLLNELLKDEIVDAQLVKVIMQDGDPSPKVAAIREYNKLRGRIIDKTQTINRLPFGETDLSTVIATLPQERQDYFYGLIADIIKEAESQRGPGTPDSSGTGIS